MSTVKRDAPVERATYQIRALERGLDILEAFSLTAPELTVAEIAQRTDLPKPTVTRLLSVLTDRGYVERVPDAERYRLGVRTLEVSSVYSQTTTIEAEAKPMMTALARETGQTANLGILDQYEVVHIEVVAPDRPVRFWASIGKREDAYLSALGKVLLTSLDADDLNTYLRRPRPSLTPHTITDAAALREELRRTAERGWGVDQQESNLGVVCVAAPVRNAAGEITAAISISGLHTEFGEGETIERLAHHVVTAADEISARLGWNPRP